MVISTRHWSMEQPATWQPGTGDATAQESWAQHGQGQTRKHWNHLKNPEELSWQDGLKMNVLDVVCLMNQSSKKQKRSDPGFCTVSIQFPLTIGPLWLYAHPGPQNEQIHYHTWVFQSRQWTTKEWQGRLTRLHSEGLLSRGAWAVAWRGMTFDTWDFHGQLQKY